MCMCMYIYIYIYIYISIIQVMRIYKYTWTVLREYVSRKHTHADTNVVCRQGRHIYARLCIYEMQRRKEKASGRAGFTPESMLAKTEVQGQRFAFPFMASCQSGISAPSDNHQKCQTFRLVEVVFMGATLVTAPTVHAGRAGFVVKEDGNSAHEQRKAGCHVCTAQPAHLHLLLQHDI